MANVRNPQLTSTNTLVAGGGSVNVEEVLSIEKSGTDSILFVFDYNHEERNVLWTYADSTDRDAEYALLIVASDVWDVATNGMFVVSSLPTFVYKTGVLSTKESGVNLNKVARITTDQGSNFLGIGGKVMYRIVFKFKGVDAIEETEWSFDDLADRDAVFAELTVEAADVIYIEV